MTTSSKVYDGDCKCFKYLLELNRLWCCGVCWRFLRLGSEMIDSRWLSVQGLVPATAENYDMELVSLTSASSTQERWDTSTDL